METLGLKRDVLTADVLTEEFADLMAWIDDPAGAARARAAGQAMLDAWEAMPSGFNVERVEGRVGRGQDPGGEYTLIDCRRGGGPHVVVAQVARRRIGVQKVTWSARQLADVQQAVAFAALMALVVADAARRDA